jgi:hypothetical protein
VNRISALYVVRPSNNSNSPALVRYMVDGVGFWGRLRLLEVNGVGFGVDGVCLR